MSGEDPLGARSAWCSSLIVLIFVWSGTQYVAGGSASTYNSARLGSRSEASVYYPPALFWWWYFYDAYAPRIFMEGGIIAASGGFLAIGIAILMCRRAHPRPRMSRPGSAEMGGAGWESSGPNCSVPTAVLGRYDQDYLRHDGPNVLCFAPTLRQGRRAGGADAADLAGSAIVHDIKGENWQLTAGFRAETRPGAALRPCNAASSA